MSLVHDDEVRLKGFRRSAGTAFLGLHSSKPVQRGRLAPRDLGEALAARPVGEARWSGASSPPAGG